MRYLFQRCRLSQRVRATPQGSTILAMQSLILLLLLAVPLSAHNGAVACYYVSTVGKDEEAVRKYIKEQEAADRQWDQLKLGE